MFEHQVQNLYASQKAQVFSSLRMPKAHVKHQQGHRRAAELTSSIIIMQNTNITVNGVEHQKTDNMNKT